jgi:hypothetical protein
MMMFVTVLLLLTALYNQTLDVRSGCPGHRCCSTQANKPSFLLPFSFAPVHILEPQTPGTCE